MTKNVQIKADEFAKLQEQQQRVVASYSERDAMFEGFREIYFMEAAETVNDRDSSDVKVTTSPAERNAVVGMTRLLKTSIPQFEGRSRADGTNVDEIDTALQSMWKVSGEVRRASLFADAGLSSVLFGPVVFAVELVDDLLLITKDDYDRALLEDIRARTPVLFRAISAENSYPTWGNYGLRAHLHKYSSTIGEIRERWGEDVLPTETDETKEQTVYDYYGPKWRVVWMEGEKEPVFAKQHGMPRIPIAVSYAGGSALFAEAEKQLQSFLYASWKGELHKRKNLLLTTLFTSVFERGTGPLFAINEDALNSDGSLTVNFAGAFRYITGEAKPINDKAYDRDLLEAMSITDQLTEESTIYSQTLGESMGGSTPFSTVAMLSRSGQLPLNDPIEAIETAIRDISTIALRWVKREGIDNELIKPAEIPDDLELTVKLKPKLPQDDLRNAQIAGQIGDKVSDEWIHTNLLQVEDSDAMKKQVFKEQAVKAMFGQMMQDPNFLAQMIQAVMPQRPQQPAPTGPMPGPMPAGPGQGMPPGMTPEQAAAMQAQGQPNMEGMPMTDPMTPPMER